MPSLKDLKVRINSVKSTQKITSAMKMVAAAKLRRAQEQAEAARPYARRLNVIEAPGGWTVVDDCYNANPASMGAALDTARTLAGGGRGERQGIEDAAQEGDLADVDGEFRRAHGQQALDGHGDHLGVGFGAVQADQFDPGLPDLALLAEALLGVAELMTAVVDGLAIQEAIDDEFDMRRAYAVLEFMLQRSLPDLLESGLPGEPVVER